MTPNVDNVSNAIDKTIFQAELNASPDKKNNESKISLRDILNCNAGNLKFGHKLLVFVKKGVWLNNQRIQRIVNDERNLIVLNKIANQMGAIQYGEIVATKDDLHEFKKVQKLSDKVLIVSKIITDNFGTIGNTRFAELPPSDLSSEKNSIQEEPLVLQEEEPLEGFDEEGLVNIDSDEVLNKCDFFAKAAEHFHDVAYIPNASSVANTPVSALYDAFIKYLVAIDATIKNADEIESKYNNFLNQYSEEAILAKKEDDYLLRTFNTIRKN